MWKTKLSKNADIYAMQKGTGCCEWLANQPCPFTAHCAQWVLTPGTEWVQALADISNSAQYCHGNKTRAPIANQPNCAQLQGTPYHSPKLHLVPCSSVGMQRETDRHTDTQTAVTTIHFASAMPHAKCNKLITDPRMYHIELHTQNKKSVKLWHFRPDN